MRAQMASAVRARLRGFVNSTAGASGEAQHLVLWGMAGVIYMTQHNGVGSAGQADAITREVALRCEAVLCAWLDDPPTRLSVEEGGYADVEAVSLRPALELCKYHPNPSR